MQIGGGHGEKLSRRKEQAIAGLLLCPTMGEAAKQAKVAETSLRRWMKEETFANAYKAARREALQHAIGQLQAGMSQAVKVLCDVMKDTDAPAPSRVSSAKAILDLALKAVEAQDFEDRITALERIAEAQESR